MWQCLNPGDKGMKKDKDDKKLSGLSNRIRKSTPSISEEDILKSQEIKDKRKRAGKGEVHPSPPLRSSKGVVETVPEVDEEEHESVVVPMVEKDIIDSKIKKSRGPVFQVSPLMGDFIKAIGANVATDILSSDVAHWYPIGCAPLDIVLGGGIPSGKTMEVFGWESSGKSTMALESVKAFQKYWKSVGKDCLTLWIESESALDKVRASYMGCDLSSVAIKEADSVETGFDAIKTFLEYVKELKIPGFIVWDTIAAVLTENERNDSWAGGMGEKARMIRKLMKQMSLLLGSTNSTLFFCNQMYQAFPVPGQRHVEDGVHGGGGIKFHASIRCHMKRVGVPIEQTLPSGQKITKGIEVQLKTKKNKLTLPHQVCSLVINGESGLDFLETLVKFLTLHKYIEIKGSWKYINFDDEQFRFQNTETLSEIISVKCPNLKVYMDYLCYKHYASISPLAKVKLLEKLWEHERILKMKPTTITDEEYSMASLISRDLTEEQDKEGEE